MAAVKKAKVKAAAKKTKSEAPVEATVRALKAPGKKAAVSMTAASIAIRTGKIHTLTARKSKISEDANALKAQRTALRASPAPIPVKKAAPVKKCKT